ncbi:hypothetical protein Tco_0529010 [Tanacetum coccineum]
MEDDEDLSPEGVDLEDIAENVATDDVWDDLGLEEREIAPEDLEDEAEATKTLEQLLSKVFDNFRLDIPVDAPIADRGEEIFDKLFYTDKSRKNNKDFDNQQTANAFSAPDTWENARPEEYGHVIMRDMLRPRKEAPGPLTCDLVPLVSKIKFREPKTFINNNLLYLLYGKTKYTPSTKKDVMFDDYTEKFLEESVLAKKYVKTEIARDRFKRYAFLGIFHL